MYKRQVIGEDNEIPIIFLHGFGASRKHWRNNLEYFAKRNCASYSLDLIGFGDSDQPGIKQIEKLNNEIWCNQVRDFIDQVIRLGLNSAYFKKDNIDRELIDLITKPVLRRTSARSLRAMCIGMSSRDEIFKASYLLRKLSASKKVPFLLIWGEKDNFIPLFVGKKIANFHRWVKLKIVSNSGHCIHDEDPSVFNRISYEWIRDLKTF